jgi:hypothetical protein
MGWGDDGAPSAMFLKKSYTSVDQFYQAVEQLILALKTNGNQEEAGRLEQVMHGVWTTSSEMIGELMLCLRGISGKFPADVRKQIDDCCYFAKHHRRILKLR